jgi:hypothetical protein
MSSCKKNPGAVNVNIDIKKKLIFTGPKGPRGNQGYRGVQGSQGDPGLIGDFGPIGFIGPRGIQGIQGATGIGGDIGPTGPQGPQGFIGLTNKWFINCSPTGAANPGDLLLNLDDCSISIFASGSTGSDWVQTGQTLQACLQCSDVVNALRNIQPVQDSCTLILTLIDALPNFNGSSQHITQLIIMNQAYPNPQTLGSFINAVDLAAILAPLGTEYITSFNTYVYVTEVNVPLNTLPHEATNKITFSNGESYDFQVQCQSDAFACDKMPINSYILASNIGLTGLTGFGTGSSATGIVWLDTDCLGITGPQGVTGAQGAIGGPPVSGTTGSQGPTGPIGPENFKTIQDLTELPSLPLTQCKYYGVAQCNGGNCLAFLDNLPVSGGSIEYSVATAVNSGSGSNKIVYGAIKFSNTTELNIALNALYITIDNNYIQILKSPKFINKLLFFGSDGKTIIANIDLNSDMCCPTGIDPNIGGDNQILMRPMDSTATGPTGGMLWAPGKCAIKPLFDLAQEICDLPPFGLYKCSITFDISTAFSINSNLPWIITNFIIFDQNLTNLYNKPINNIPEFNNLLLSNGWTQNDPLKPIFTLIQYNSTSLVDTECIIRISDANSSIFFVEQFDVTCTSFNDNNFKIILIANKPDQADPPYNPSGATGATGATGGTGGSTGATGSATGGVTGVTGATGGTGSTGSTGATVICEAFLGGADKFFNGIDYCSDTSYNCTASIIPSVAIADLNSVSLPAPWKIKNITIAGVELPVLGSLFSGVLQLAYLLQTLGWVLLSNGTTWQFTVSGLNKPNVTSSITFQAASGPTQKIDLVTTCIADCTSTNTDRSVLSRNPVIGQPGEFNYCFIDPNCFNKEVINVDCCTGCTGSTKLEQIPNCDNNAKYDLLLTYTQATIDLILCTYKNKNNGNNAYWIYDYRILSDSSTGSSGSTGSTENQILIKKYIDYPLSLTTLTKAFTELGWVPYEDSADNTQIQLVFNNSDIIISSVNINLADQTVFNINIPLDHILRVDCLNVPRDGLILVKQIGGGTGAGSTGPTGLGETGLPYLGPSGLCLPGSFKPKNSYCYMDIDCFIPQITPFNLAFEMTQLPDCIDYCLGPSGATGATGASGASGASGVTGISITPENCLGDNLPPCEDRIEYVICLPLDETDEGQIRAEFDNTLNLQIKLYEMIDGTVCALEPAIDIGVNPTLMTIVNTLVSIGWTAPVDLTLRPIRLHITSAFNIRYIGIHPEIYTDISIAPFPHMIGCNCLQKATCPSTNTLNKVLIKNSAGVTGGAVPCWTPICTMTGPQGAPYPGGVTGGVTGFAQWVTGPTGHTGFNGFTGAQGPEGVQGEDGPTGQYLTAYNVGTGAEIFESRTGPTSATGPTGTVFTILNFKTLLSGKNIQIDDNPSDLTISVKNDFDWGDTIFSGTTGAIVLPGSNMCFLAGATLLTNYIQETTTEAGVTIEGVVCKDGGIDVTGFVGATGATSRPTFLDEFEFGELHTAWIFDDTGLGFQKEVDSGNILFYQRLGNTVTMNIPEFNDGATGPTGIGFSIINTVPLPLKLQTSQAQYFIIKYNDPNKSGTSSYPFGPVGADKLGLVTINGPVIRISKDLDDNGFTYTDTFGLSEPLAVTYFIN